MAWLASVSVCFKKNKTKPPPPKSITSVLLEFDIYTCFLSLPVLVIGRGGEQISRLQQESGCKIQIAPGRFGFAASAEKSEHTNCFWRVLCLQCLLSCRQRRDARSVGDINRITRINPVSVTPVSYAEFPWKLVWAAMYF